MKLTDQQKDAKIAYLLQENQRLRESLLDQQILTGAIRLEDENQDTTYPEEPADVD